MSETTTPRITKWPFIAGYFLLLGVAALTVWQGQRPMTLGEMALCAGAVACGAVLCVVAFILEYRATVQLAQADVLAASILQLQRLETISNSINAATAQWLGVQDQAAQTLKASQDISDRMTAEAAEFAEFLKQANDAEKATLRLEVDKLRRAEGDWLQVVVRMLDHIYALHLAAARGDKPEVAEQIGRFQLACRDIARRVGLVPFEAQPGEPFDEARHKSVDEQTPVPGDARVKETLGVGITFQGKLVRPALVVVEPAPAPGIEPEAGEGAESSSVAEPGELSNPTEEPPADPGQRPLL